MEAEAIAQMRECEICANSFEKEIADAKKAGEQQGITTAIKAYESTCEELIKCARKEVVEWIHKEFGGYIPDSKGGLILKNILIDEEYGEDGSMDKWQAQLKVWGIK